MSYRLASQDLDPIIGEAAGLAPVSEQRDAFTAISGRSAAFRETVETARRIARQGASNVLLCGESGTGKEVFARAIHYEGPRPNAPFVPINCAAIPPSLLESELFGYDRGALTDTRHTKEGLLELARDGTLFVDEVSSVPLDLQPKLLRALEERRVRRVGGFREIEVRCRVIAATKDSLERLVRSGSLREDLYHRLNASRLALPPLRERSGDVRWLAERFLADGSAAQGLTPVRLTAKALAALERHSWPGNVRELKNVIERALALSDGGDIDVDGLMLNRRAPRGLPLAADATTGVITVPAGGRSLRSVEGELLRITLALTAGNKSAAARILGISRPTLHKKLDDYGFETPRVL